MSDIYITSDGGIVTLEDTDGDGYAETTWVDADRDGEDEALLLDYDSDGYDDIAYFDNSPGDDHFQADVQAIDHNGDGFADRIRDDLDFDGEYDAATDVGPFGPSLGNANPYGPDLQDAVDEIYTLL